MPLRIYKESDGVGPISYDNTYSNPILYEVSPDGGILEKRYYIRMENQLTQYATNCRIYAIDASGTDDTDWFSFAPDGPEGGPGTYSSEYNFIVPLGAEIPIWIRVTVPDGLEIEPKDDVSIAIDYIEEIDEEAEIEIE